MEGSWAQEFALDAKTWFSTTAIASDFFRPAHIADLRQFLEELPRDREVSSLGSGSGLMFLGRRYDGVVIYLGSRFGGFELLKNDAIRVGAGAKTADVVYKASQAGFDMSFLAGMPGTIAGALVGNAGFQSKTIRELFSRATVVSRDGTVRTLQAGADTDLTELSDVLDGGVIVQAVLTPPKATAEAVGRRVKEALLLRETCFPSSQLVTGPLFNLGPASSTFPNKEETPSVEHLIQSLGLILDQHSSLRSDPKFPNILIGSSREDAQAVPRFGEQIRSECKTLTGFALEWKLQMFHH